LEERKKILIADDDEDIVQILKSFIERNFPQLFVFTASDGARAMQNLEKIQFDFLFLDLNIPKISGSKILNEINFLDKNHRPKNVFVITGEDVSDMQVTGLQRSIFYFGKPIDFEKLKSTISNILNPAPVLPAKAALDVRFMNPFIDSTVNVLKVTASTEATKEEVNVSKGDSFKGDISAFYPIHSPLFEGFFCLSFPKSTYLKIMSRMLYSEFTEINEENRDGAAELCNQIFGNAKAYFNDKHKTSIKMSTPSITIGDSHKVVSVLKAPRIIVKFSTDSGDFFVEVSFAKVAGAANA
jgi:chemotaxis protein CheX